jgi:hypothetical protein
MTTGADVKNAQTPNGKTSKKKAKKAKKAKKGKVRKTPSWPRSWVNTSLLQLYSHRNAWANLRLLGQPDTFLAKEAERKSGG